ncbi:MAG: PAS domain S-box protein [Desulfonatronovibrio sp.]
MSRPSKKKNQPDSVNFPGAHDILMNAPIGITTTTPDGRLLSANPAMAKMFGYDSPDELIESVNGITTHLYAALSDREALMRILRENDEVLNFECKGNLREGGTIWISLNVSVVRDKDGKILHFQSFITDITHRKQMEKALQQSRQYYRSVFETSGAAQVIIEEDTTISLANSRFEQLVGYSRKEIEGKKSWTEFVHQGDLEWMKKQHYSRRQDSNAAPRVYEFRLVDALGRIRDIFLSIDLIPNTRQSVASLLDITDRKQAEEEREKLQAMLFHSQKMESIGTLAGGVAHDFNNLLHAMRGNIELLAESESFTPRDTNRLTNITKSMDRAAQLVKKLLLFSRKADIQTGVLDLNQEIHDAVKLLEISIPKMVNIELILDDNIWPISADPIQVEQVLLNLGTNAADAMPDGGRLIIETANKTLDEDFVRTHSVAEPGEYVLMTVSDTGHGMDKKTKARIFDPFFTTKEIEKGTGLGLASVYGIVKAHGGYILCYSEPGQGTAFKIYWPVAGQGEIGPDEKQTEQAVSQYGTETILVVDDDTQIRDLTTEVLEDSGYQVLNAESGEKALAIFKKRPNEIDLVIMDLNMPGMGGRECTRQMLSVDPSVKVLVASGYSAVGHSKETSESGAKGFLSKPYHKKELLVRIRKLLDGEQG